MPSSSTLFALTFFFPIIYGAVWNLHPRNVSLTGEPRISSLAAAVAILNATAVTQSKSKAAVQTVSTINSVSTRPPASACPPAPPPNTPPPTTTSVSAPEATSSSVPSSSGGALNPNSGSRVKATRSHHSNPSVDSAINSAATTEPAGASPANSNGGGSARTVPPSATSVPAEAPPSSGGAASPSGGGSSTQTQSPPATSVPASTGSPPNPSGGSVSMPTQSPSATSIDSVNPADDGFGPPTASPVSTPRSTLNATYTMYTSTPPPIPTPKNSGRADGGGRPGWWMSFEAATVVLVHYLILHPVLLVTSTRLCKCVFLDLQGIG
ncbi:hypothetical protein K438DRAFT_1780688 [Mycena galopus ATCC 62051]|nr:hypothetical protein K438DRAFT_1780688 [Mycena galopus ATCC 62051]